MAEGRKLTGKGGESTTPSTALAANGGIRKGTVFTAAGVFVGVNVLILVLEFLHLTEIPHPTAVLISFLCAAIGLLIELCVRIERIGHEVQLTAKRLTERLDALEQGVAAKVEWRATVLQTLLTLAEKLPTEGDRRPFIEQFLVNQGHLLASTDPLVRSLHRSLLSYFDHWLRVDIRAGEVEKIRVHATQVQTYPIYQAFISVVRNCDALRAINQIDLAWWVSSEGIQYITDNLAAVNENRVTKVERIFVLRKSEWGQDHLKLLKQIYADFAAKMGSSRVSLKAVFYEDIAHLQEADLDAVVFKNQAALKWERPTVRDADPIIIVSFKPEDVQAVEAKIEAVSRNGNVQLLDEFIRQQETALVVLPAHTTPAKVHNPQAPEDTQNAKPAGDPNAKTGGK